MPGVLTSRLEAPRVATDGAFILGGAATTAQAAVCQIGAPWQQQKVFRRPAAPISLLETNALMAFDSARFVFREQTGTVAPGIEGTGAALLVGGVLLIRH